MTANREWLEVSEVVRLLGWNLRRVLRKIFKDWEQRNLVIAREALAVGSHEFSGLRFLVSWRAIEEQYRKFGRDRSEGPVLKPSGQWISLAQLASQTGRTESSLRGDDVKLWKKMGLAKTVPVQGSKTLKLMVDACLVPVAKARKAKMRRARDSSEAGLWN
jgi:hypothetical protein